MKRGLEQLSPLLSLTLSSFPYPLSTEPETRVLFPTRAGEERKDKDKGRGRRVGRAAEGKGRTHCCSQKLKPKVLVTVEGRLQPKATAAWLC